MPQAKKKSRKRTRLRKLSDAELLTGLRRVARKLGATPRVTDLGVFARAGLCATAATYYSHFGSFRAALRKAGLKPARKPAKKYREPAQHSKYSEADLLDGLRRATRELVAVPRTNDLPALARGGFCAPLGTYYEHFGSFRTALRKAGLKRSPRPPTFRFSEERMIGDLQTLERKLGRLPSSTDIRQAGFRGECTSWVTYLKRYGGIRGVYQAAGLPLPETRQKMLAALRRLGTPEGYAPNKKSFQAAYLRGECEQPKLYRIAFGSLAAAWNQAGLKVRETAAQVITREQLLDDLRRYAAELGHTPSATEWMEGTRRGKLRKYGRYTRRFGSLPEARTAAGLAPIEHSMPRSSEALLDGLRCLAQELGYSPNGKEIDGGCRRRICASSRTYRSHFGSLDQARQAAGLPPLTLIQRKRSAKVAPGEALEGLRRLANELGHSPTRAEIEEGSRRGICASDITYRRRFGDLANARSRAGLPPVSAGGSRITEEKTEAILQGLRRLAQELGRPPTASEVENGCRRGICAAWSTYRRRFGGIVQARAAAGLSAIPKANERSPEEILEGLRRLARELGHSPTDNEIDQGSGRRICASAATYRHHFGSIVRARVAAGLPPLPNASERSQEEILEGLRRLARELGHSPTEREIEQGSRRGICASTPSYRHRFGSITEARRAAGLDPLEKYSRGVRHK